MLLALLLDIKDHKLTYISFHSMFNWIIELNWVRGMIWVGEPGVEKQSVS